MKIKEYLEKFGLEKIKLNLKFAEIELKENDYDENAAWEMYVELITRVSTQKLVNGDEKTALESVHKIFQITRDILKKYGRKTEIFSKIAIIVLNQVIRPFTAKWHKFLLESYLDTEEGKENFRKELELLQIDLRNYTLMLADLAKVEDLTTIIE